MKTPTHVARAASFALAAAHGDRKLRGRRLRSRLATRALLGTPFVLKTATSPGATVLMKDGILCLLAKQPGHLAVALAFEIPADFAQSGAPPIRARPQAGHRKSTGLGLCSCIRPPHSMAEPRPLRIETMRRARKSR